MIPEASVGDYVSELVGTLELPLDHSPSPLPQ
jgi:hypothetical protein